MAKIGVNLKINVNEIKKEKLFKGEKGTYLDLVTFIDVENANEFGSNGTIRQRGEKCEEMPILGNAKIFWRDEIKEQKPKPKQEDKPVFDSEKFDDDIPF